MMILNMDLEVPGEMLDALAQQRNLHFGRAGVRRMDPELLDYNLFFCGSVIPISPIFFSLSFLVE